MGKLEKVENEFTKMIREIRERKFPGAKQPWGSQPTGQSNR